MSGIDSSIMTHWVNIDPSIRLVKHKRREFNVEHYMAIQVKVDKIY